MPPKSQFRRTALAFACLLAWTSSGQAELSENEKDSVRLLANDAAADYAAGHLPEALDKFKRAYRRARVPKLALWLAKTEMGLGHWVRAAEFCLEATQLEKSRLWVGTLQQTAQREAGQLREELLKRIPRLIIRVEGVPARDVTLHVDNIAVSGEPNGAERLVDPGTHEITGQSGVRVLELRATFAERERKEIALQFVPTQARAPSQPPLTTRPPTAESRAAGYVDTQQQLRRMWGWVGVSVGAAGLLTGAVTGVAVALKHDELKDECPARVCSRDQWSELDNYDLMRRVSSVGFAIGAIGSAVGLGLLFSTPRSARADQLGWWIAPNSAGVAARF